MKHPPVPSLTFFLVKILPHPKKKSNKSLLGFRPEPAKVKKAVFAMFFFDFLSDLGQKLEPPLNWHEHGPFSGSFSSGSRLGFLDISSK